MDRARGRPDDRDVGGGERRRDTQRSLTAKLNDHPDQRAGPALGVDDLQDVLDGERLHIEPVGGVVVGGHRLRVTVDHDRLVTGGRQRHHRVAAGVVELDALSDPVRPATQNNHPRPVAGGDLSLGIVGRVVVGRGGCELGRAGVDRLVDRPDAGAVPERADHVLLGPQDLGELRVGETRTFGPQDPRRVAADGRGDLVDAGDLLDEPAIDAGDLGDPGRVSAGPQCLLDRAQPPVMRNAGPFQELVGIPGPAREGEHRAGLLEGPQGLLQRLGEATPHAHGLTDRLHRGRQRRVRPGELLEGEAGHLHHHVVQCRFERRRCGAGDVVGDLVQGVTEREFRRYLRDRVSGGLRGQGRRPGHPGIHLDHDEPPGGRVHRELDVAATRVDAHRAHHRDGHVPHLLVLAVGQRHRRCHRHRVAGVHAHRVDVLDRADHDHVVGAVTHQLELELLPAEDGLLDEHLRGRARGDAVLGHPAQFTGVMRDTAAGAAESEARPHHDRVLEFLGGVEALLRGRADGAAGGLTADRRDDVLERLTVLTGTDRVDVRTDQADAVPVQDTGVVQRDRGVQRGLATHRREQRIGPLPVDDFGDHVECDRFDVGGVGQIRVGHDRGRIAVDQHHPQAFGAQHPAGLGAGVVELAGLTDDDRP